MDDTAQKNPQSDDAQQALVQPAPSVSHQPVGPLVAPSGAAHKEHAPLASPVAEHIRPAPHEAIPVIPEEASSHLEISVSHEQPKVSDEHRKLGVKEAGALLPAPTVLSDDKTLPLTAQQVTQSQGKEYTVWDSFKWYGKTVGRQMLRKFFLKNDK